MRSHPPANSREYTHQLTFHASETSIIQLPQNSFKKSVEDLMGYSDDYVNNASIRQPGNPLSATSNHRTMYGLESTPQFVTRKRIVDRLPQHKRVLETPWSSNWNLTVCEAVDLSRLCGVDAVLMCETCLSPEAFVSHKYGNRSIDDEYCQHSLEQWVDDQQSSIQMYPTPYTTKRSERFLAQYDQQIHQFHSVQTCL